MKAMTAIEQMVYYQASFYAWIGQHENLNVFDQDFNKIHRDALKFYKEQKKTKRLSELGYIGVDGTGDEFSVIYVTQKYIDMVDVKWFQNSTAFERWMKVAKNVLKTGKPEIGSF